MANMPADGQLTAAAPVDHARSNRADRHEFRRRTSKAWRLRPGLRFRCSKTAKYSQCETERTSKEPRAISRCVPPAGVTPEHVAPAIGTRGVGTQQHFQPEKAEVRPRQRRPQMPRAVS